jgi:Glycogen recognition site of AMP-activated protein kinase
MAYKFIVDEQWMVVEHEPTELDHDGNLNNVYIAPPKPPSSALEADSDVFVSSVDPAESETATGEPEAASGPPFPQIVADLANTVAAREGTTSALSYVASGLGAAIHSVVGYDPVNAEQVIIQCARTAPCLTLCYTRLLCLLRTQIFRLVPLRNRHHPLFRRWNLLLAKLQISFRTRV